MKCTHENADHLKPGDLFALDQPYTPPVRVLYEQFRCVDCGAWLSLGDADEPEIDVRAAQLARISRWSREYKKLTFLERSGLAEVGGIVKLKTEDPQWQAGYLAFQILDHDENENDAEPVSDALIRLVLERPNGHCSESSATGITVTGVMIEVAEELLETMSTGERPPLKGLYEWVALAFGTTREDAKLRLCGAAYGKADTPSPSVSADNANASGDPA
jgi:hypothetical protein